MTEVKQYTREEFENSFIEFHESDVAGLVGAVLKYNEWLINDYGVAMYFNAELSPRSFWDRCYAKVHPSAAMRPDSLIPNPNGLSSSYSLQGVYFGEQLDLAEMVKKIKVVRPAVVFVDAGYDVNGNNRRAWVLYNEGELFRIIRDNDQEDHLWQDYGAEKAWASGKLSITETVWNQLWDKKNWPVSDRRFPSYAIEELYTWGQNGFSDDATGDGDSHWAYKFDEDLTILHYDAWGNFSTEEFGEQELLDRRWDEIVEEYNPDDEEEDDEE